MGPGGGRRQSALSAEPGEVADEIGRVLGYEPDVSIRPYEEQPLTVSPLDRLPGDAECADGHTVKLRRPGVTDGEQGEVWSAEGVEEPQRPPVRLPAELVERLPWVTYQRAYDAPPVRQLGMLGIEPRVEVSVDSFQALPFLGAYEAVPVHEALWWHPVHIHDAAHLWLRETAERVGASVGRQRRGRQAIHHAGADAPEPGAKSLGAAPDRLAGEC